MEFQREREIRRFRFNNKQAQNGDTDYITRLKAQKSIGGRKTDYLPLPNRHCTLEEMSLLQYRTVSMQSPCGFSLLCGLDWNNLPGLYSTWDGGVPARSSAGDLGELSLGLGSAEDLHPHTLCFTVLYCRDGTLYARARVCYSAVMDKVS
jgi:hypothetical protein